MFLCPVGANPAMELLRGANQAGGGRQPRRRDRETAVKPSLDHNAAVTKTFIEALNRRDLDDFLSVLAHDVELRTFKGVKRGVGAAAEWFDRPLDHLELEFTDVTLIVAGNRVVGRGMARFTWKETGDLAEETAASAGVAGKSRTGWCGAGRRSRVHGRPSPRRSPTRSGRDRYGCSLSDVTETHAELLERGRERDAIAAAVAGAAAGAEP